LLIDLEYLEFLQKKRMKENKARPVFTRCEPAFLLENSPARTYVTQVQATDEDSQEPGAITYQMVGLENKLKFNVDPINGTITSDYVILHTHTHTHTHILLNHFYGGSIGFGNHMCWTAPGCRTRSNPICIQSHSFRL